LPQFLQKNNSLIVHLVKILPRSLQLSILGIGFLQRREIYKTNITGMLTMLNKDGSFSKKFQLYLKNNGMEKAESIFIKSKDGKNLHILYHPSKNGKLVCAFHGIKGNWFSNPADKNAPEQYNPYYRMEVLKHFVKDGFGFFAFSMPGFHPSEGTPSEVNFINACDAFSGYVISKADILPSNIIVWGESLGAANAAIFASIITHKNYAPALLSMVAPFDSLINMVRLTFPYFSEKTLEKYLCEKLDTVKLLSELDKKTYIHIVSANDDTLIPLKNTQNLVYKARNLGLKAIYHPTDGTHTTWNSKEITSVGRLVHKAREANIEIAEHKSVEDIEKILARK